MRQMFVLAILAAGLLGAASPASASCDIGGREVACATENGEYRIRTPAGAGPFPTVVYLYGSLGNAKSLIDNEGFVQAFVDRGYAVIVPSGSQLRYASGMGTGWFLRNMRNRKKRDDAAFVAEVLEDATIRHRIDRNRVLIAGMSNGAFLTWEIACHNPLLAAAYAPVAGGYLGAMPDHCEGPVRLMHTHGLTDPIVTVDGSGARISGGARIMLLSESMARVGASSGCAGPGAPQPFREYSRTSWQDCPYGASLDLLLHKGGHTIPLSWFSTVVDWFEDGFRTAPAGGFAAGGGTARFVRPGGAARSSRFKRAGQRD